MSIRRREGKAASSSGKEAAGLRASTCYAILHAKITHCTQYPGNTCHKEMRATVCEIVTRGAHTHTKRGRE